ncbi:LysR family transcriptional regulator [Variovorax sp. J22R133]|uniref:LysR family transcriptional regulator n=1 Tax=Variovorax brevis TaxID=3053503 RepID=UPI002576489A|nr:LysR family transcriptional regulator [Variovorax sp. J22R133]MDM0113730.1 LysR family transcriptional regulator [Variovorax sp. J22R133]
MDWIDRIGRRVKLRDLHILLTLAQAGSMGRAATALSISQPVISKAIAELESTLGARLFDRTGQGVVPTDYGRAMIHCGRAVFDELQQGVKAIEFLGDPASGHLHIGCTEFGAIGLVPLVIERLGLQHPRMQFHVTTADPISLTAVDLPQRNIELAMSAIPAELPPDIEAEPLFEDRHVIVAGSQSPWARRRKLRLEDLQDALWVLPPPDSPGRRYVDEAFAARGLVPPVAQVSTFSMPLCHQLLASGHYVAILPREASRLARHLPIKTLNVDVPGLRRSIGMLTLKNRTLSPVARLFMEAARLTAKSLSLGVSDVGANA